MRVIRMVVSTCPAPAAGLAAWAVVNAVAPLAMVAAMARTVSLLPDVARTGHGHVDAALVTSLIVTSVLLVVSLVVGPFRETLNAMTTPRLTYALQARLMDAVSAPIGIAHLEDAAVLDRLELAQGSLSSSAPAEAPNSLAAVASTKLAGTLACAIVAVEFRWWLGLGIFAFWVGVRQPVRRQLVATARSFSGDVPVLRRAGYFRQIAAGAGSAKETRIFGLVDWGVDRYRSNFLDGMTRIWRLQNRQATLICGVLAGMVVVYGGAFVLLAERTASGDLDLGHVALLVPMLTMTMLVGSVDGSDVALEFALAAFPHLDQLESVIDDRRRALPGGLPAPVLHDGIRFEDVAFTYPAAAAPIFQRLDLYLPAGRSTAIVGANGAGKTTLVKLLARLHDPHGGQITVDGIDISTLDASSWQRRVAVVFQDFTQYPMSAADNVGFGAVEHASDRPALEAAARRAGAFDLIEHLPQGWDTILSREFSFGTDLSGGQWQRIALARALFAVDHGATVLVLDEPTSWLDAQGEAEFFDRFLDLTSDVTTVIISHRFSTVRRADHICVLDDGVVVEQGSHDELVALGGSYATSFGLQAGRFHDVAPAGGLA